MKLIKKYASDRFDKLINLLDRYDKTPTEEILHNIRVELKKIKALFHLINFCSKKFNVSKEYRSLREIFREAGKIREMEVLNKLFLEYQIKPVNEEIKSGKQNLLVSNFRKNISRYKRMTAAIPNSIDKHSEKVNSSCLKKYSEVKKEKLNKQIFPILIIAELHNIRKIIKEIIYITGISRWSRKKLDPFYEDIQNLIGSLHDKQMLLKLLEEQFPGSHGESIIRLKSKCKTDIKNIILMISKFHKSDMLVMKSSNI